MHYNGVKSYVFINGVEVIKIKAKDFEIVEKTLCWRNISKEFSADNLEKVGLNKYIYYFNVDCNAAAVDNTSDIHKSFINKSNGIKLCLDLLKNAHLQQWHLLVTMH